jgi:voltage-gated potassium channel
VIQEHELEERTPLPIHKIAETPELAVEHYKMLLSQIRQLGIQTDSSKFDEAAVQGQRLSDAEFALWQKIQGKA